MTQTHTYMCICICMCMCMCVCKYMGMRPSHTQYLEQHEDESQDVEYGDAEHQPPQHRVGPHEGAVRHVDHTNQNEHHHHRNRPPEGKRPGDKKTVDSIFTLLHIWTCTCTCSVYLRVHYILANLSSENRVTKIKIAKFKRMVGSIFTTRFS